MKWNRKNLSAALGVDIKRDFESSQVSINTRSIENGDVFVGIKGENFDGSDYVIDALNKGAAIAISSKSYGLDNVIVVEDTLKALEKMALYSRGVINPRTIGITGSVGKTSTKELTALAISAYATKGNLNNHIGVPLTLANMPDYSPRAVIEIGMNHAGEVTKLCDIVKPEIAIVTGAAAAHLEFFDSIEAIADAESEILHKLPSNGVAIINAENKYYEYIRNIARKAGVYQILSYGREGNIYAKMLDFKVTESGSEIKAMLDFQEITYKLSSFSPHQAINSLAALSAAKIIGFDIHEAMNNLANFTEPKGRGRLNKLKLQNKNITLIDDSYNASPDSVVAAMANLKNLRASLHKGARTIMVLGDMLELGDTESELHSELAVYAKQYGIDKILTCGKLMQNLNNALPTEMKFGHYSKSNEIDSDFINSLNDNDIILVKGSHGSRMDVVVELLTNFQL